MKMLTTAMETCLQCLLPSGDYNIIGIESTPIYIYSRKFGTDIRRNGVDILVDCWGRVHGMTHTYLATIYYRRQYGTGGGQWIGYKLELVDDVPVLKSKDAVALGGGDPLIDKQLIERTGSLGRCYAILKKRMHSRARGRHLLRVCGFDTAMLRELSDCR